MQLELFLSERNYIRFLWLRDIIIQLSTIIYELKEAKLSRKSEKISVLTMLLLTKEIQEALKNYKEGNFFQVIMSKII